MRAKRRIHFIVIAKITNRTDRLMRGVNQVEARVKRFDIKGGDVA
jgi:hypothetical protein